MIAGYCLGINAALKFLNGLHHLTLCVYFSFHRRKSNDFCPNLKRCSLYFVKKATGLYLSTSIIRIFVHIMKIYKKPLWMCIALLVYVTGMAIYFVPRNQEMSSAEKTITVIVAYVLVVALWFAMQYREKLRRKEKN